MQKFKRKPPQVSEYKYSPAPDEIKDFNQLRVLEGIPVLIKKLDGSSLETDFFEVTSEDKRLFYSGVPVKEIKYIVFYAPPPVFRNYFDPTPEHPLNARIKKWIGREEITAFLFDQEQLIGILQAHLPYSIVISPSNISGSFYVIMKHAMWMWGGRGLKRFIPYFNAQISNLKEAGKYKRFLGWRSSKSYLKHDLSKKLFFHVFYKHVLIAYTIERIAILGEARDLTRSYLGLRLYYRDRGKKSSVYSLVLRHALSGFRVVHRARIAPLILEKSHSS